METVDEVLEHFGVRGMHWGVRKDNTTGGSGSKSDSKSGTASKSWSKDQVKAESAFMSTNTIITNSPPKVNSFTVDNTGKPAVVVSVSKGSKADHDYAVSVLKRPLHSYEKVVNVTTMNEHQARAAKANAYLSKDKRPKNPDHPVHPSDKMFHSGETASGKGFGDYNAHGEKNAFRYRKYSTGEKLFSITNSDTWEYGVRADGSSAKSINDLDAIKHSELETVDEVLEHFGVRGMHWGVRKDRTTRVKVGEELKTIKVPHNTSTDAMKAHNSAVMIKRHGIKSVTNQELKDLNYRISLEQNFHKMVPKETGRIKKGRDIMEKMVWKAGEEQLQPYIGKYAGKGLATVLGPVIPGSAPIIEEIGKHTYYRGKHGMS